MRKAMVGLALTLGQRAWPSMRRKRSGPVEYQGTASGGLVRRFYDSDTMKLTTQIGFGYRSLRPEELIRDEDCDEVVCTSPCA